MRRDTRAVVFDLDDTLYPYRRFRTSGFLAVAHHLQTRAGLDARLGFAALMGASRGAARGTELQACLHQYDLPPDWLSDLVDVLRYHTPRLKLTPVVGHTLRTLRADGWRLGVLTNGVQSIQAAKVAALDLARHVDVVVYAGSVGSGVGKPDPEAFAHVARVLSVPATRTVFVGDDERCDVGGALRAGMVPVRVVPSSSTVSSAARTVVTSLARIPVIAATLVEESSNRHAA